MITRLLLDVDDKRHRQSLYHIQTPKLKFFWTVDFNDTFIGERKDAKTTKCAIKLQIFLHIVCSTNEDFSFWKELKREIEKLAPLNRVCVFKLMFFNQNS